MAKISQTKPEPFRWLSMLLQYGCCIILLIAGDFDLKADGKTNIQSFDYFSQDDGLPNNQIQCILQDKKGWLWVGTSQGLSRFDGYRFNNFLNVPGDTNSLSGRLIRVIFESRDGRLFVGTENGGLNLFDREKERFLHPYNNHKEFGAPGTSVNSIAEDGKGTIWIGTERSLFRLDGDSSLEKISWNPENSLTGGLFIRSIQIDDLGGIWIGATEGLFVYHPENNSIEEIRLPLKPGLSKEVWKILKDEEGLMWIGTYSGGLFLTDPVTGNTSHIDLAPYYERTETIRAISKGKPGDFWIGTRGGMYVYSKLRGVTGFFRHDERDTRSLANNSVLDIFHDSRGETWIGTRGGLNLLARSRQVFRSFGALPDDSRYLNSSIIYAFWIDDRDRIWVGTEDGGINIYDPVTGTYKYLTTDAGDLNTISQNCIKAFLDDGKGNLWIGTFLGGLDMLNLKTGKIVHYKNIQGDNSSLSDNRVWALCSDDEGKIWIGTNTCLDRFDPVSRRFDHFPEIIQNKQVNWIRFDSEKDLWIGTPDEIVIYDPGGESIIRFPERSRSFLEDSEHNFWIATLDKGIALYNKTNGPLMYLDEKNGLANNMAMHILEDESHKLWISTSRGLSRYDPDKKQFRNFTSKDGLRNDQFSYGAACMAKNGDLLFGGISGFNMFNPAEIVEEDQSVPLVFTELRLFNRPVGIGSDEDAILHKSISESDQLVMRYDQNVITLQFAALDFVNSASSLYSYYLEGFEKDWSEPGPSRTATYTNLNPGDYTLKVKRILSGATPSDDHLEMNITVLPPFWMTWWFRSAIMLVIALLLWAIIKFFINREKIRNELFSERARARDLHELDMLKLSLFTNISHEIRTPLTLILGPLEKLINGKVTGAAMHSHIDLVYRNTRQLDRLINQLLDFRKLETGNLKLEVTQDDMVTLITDVVSSFEDFAKEKQITLKFNTLKKKLVAIFDPDKVETILNNLLSNALKYTDKGGTVIVHLSLIFSHNDDDISNDEADRQYIEISVKDTGRGISENNIGKIFNRFFRAEENYESSGTGIGLSLVKELVKLHGGSVTVRSKPGKGSKFTIQLPYETSLPGKTLQITEESEEIKESNSFEPAPVNTAVKERVDDKIMLIVEDNPDVRFFIRSHFDAVYKIFEAGNGQEGWQVALRVIPDVIISDILMPDSSGYEFCRRIKKDERTSHIPLLLLTALHSKEHEMEGLSCGADDFITKPFDISVLETKIGNMLSIRSSLREKYTRELILKPSDIIVTSPDERFILKALEVVEKNIPNPGFDIETFAAEAGVSRMQLYRKFNALTNMTVKEFVRSIRLKRAAQLLLDKKMTISEIAFRVGFRDLSNFRKCFHREFGISATEYILRNSSKN